MDTSNEETVTIATALYTNTLEVRVDPGDPWAPLRTHEMWSTDANTHSVGIIPIRYGGVASQAEEPQVERLVSTADTSPRLLDMDELGKALGLSRNQVERLLQTVPMPGFGFGAQWFVSSSDLNQWLNGRPLVDEVGRIERVLNP